MSKIDYIYNKIAKEEIEFFNMFSLLITGQSIIEDKKEEMSREILTKENDEIVKQAQEKLIRLGF